MNMNITKNTPTINVKVSAFAAQLRQKHCKRVKVEYDLHWKEFIVSFASPFNTPFMVYICNWGERKGHILVVDYNDPEWPERRGFNDVEAAVKHCTRF